MAENKTNYALIFSIIVTCGTKFEVRLGLGNLSNPVKYARSIDWVAIGSLNLPTAPIL